MKINRRDLLSAAASLAAAFCVASSLPVRAAVILDNDFSSVTAAAYDPGDSLGADPLLGVVTGHSGFTVNSSNYAEVSGYSAVRSTGTSAITNKTRFAFSFFTDVAAAKNSAKDLPAAAGWAVVGGLEDSNATTQGVTNRMLVGVSGWEATDTLRLVTWGTLGTTSIDLGATPFSYATDTWYDMSFILQYDAVADQWTVSDLAVKLQSTQATVISLPSKTFSTSGYGGSVEGATDSQAYAFFGARNNSNVYVQADRLDNLYAAIVVPEPETIAMVFAGVLALLLRRRRATFRA